MWGQGEGKKVWGLSSISFNTLQMIAMQTGKKLRELPEDISKLTYDQTIEELDYYANAHFEGIRAVLLEKDPEFLNRWKQACIEYTVTQANRHRHRLGGTKPCTFTKLIPLQYATGRGDTIIFLSTDTHNFIFFPYSMFLFPACGSQRDYVNSSSEKKSHCPFVVYILSFHTK